jgi:hypothetical protein
VPVRDSCSAPHRAPMPVRQVNKSGQARKTGRGVPVRESCRAPYSAPRPVRVGKKSGPAEGLQGRSVRGRQLHYGHTSQPADHINRQLVKQQRRYLFKA